MGNLVVVVSDPSLGLLSYFGEVAENIHVKHATPGATVEALNESVLHWPLGLDEVQDDAFAFLPFSQGSAMNSGPLSKRRLVG
jgi:hypothetical protein